MASTLPAAMAQPAERNQMEQLRELQNRSMELRRHLTQLSGQVEAAAHERQALERTLKELSAMKPETETYKVIGKMFLLQTQAELTDQVTAELGEAVSSVEMRLKLRSQFVEKLKENELGIEELVASFSAQK
ncbi:hypothetical protein BU14_0709s0001 [Porphyra umbilicalis]|uniref:Prefoldin subunit 2 n=1 Tax=Porphyra umbilicalis TaxID=2786 RepID=A0A1X6NPU8_PORUM|nr:hypothetical protein BU14_0709s0001 [Porphyra umbilicalis]|eukprot:OSX70617.1 hypothetical protein BU14_0709s0001 [Porphyra umbilicalis]